MTVVSMAAADPTPYKPEVLASRYWSCHTAVVDGYFVEGHVPVEAIVKLLQESADIAGIALPGMPSGSPGMPGEKNGLWTIYALTNGQALPFTSYSDAPSNETKSNSHELCSAAPSCPFSR